MVDLEQASTSSIETLCGQEESLQGTRTVHSGLGVHGVNQVGLYLAVPWGVGTRRQFQKADTRIDHIEDWEEAENWKLCRGRLNPASGLRKPACYSQ